MVRGEEASQAPRGLGDLTALDTSTLQEGGPAGGTVLAEFACGLCGFVHDA